MCLSPRDFQRLGCCFSQTFTFFTLFGPPSSSSALASYMMSRLAVDLVASRNVLRWQGPTPPLSKAAGIFS